MRKNLHSKNLREESNEQHLNLTHIEIIARLAYSVRFVNHCTQCVK